jgi:hypothetical protein
MKRLLEALPAVGLVVGIFAFSALIGRRPRRSEWIRNGRRWTRR